MTPNSITVTALDLISAAMQEINYLAAGETVPADDSAWGLQKLQRLIDRYNAREAMIYNVGFEQFTLVPNLAPHTIGPTPAVGPAPTFIVNQRPVDIPSIGVQLVSSTPVTEVPLYKMTQDEWAAERVKNLTSSFPTKYYYSPDWPNGSIFFWPIPTAVNNVLIQQRLVLAQVTAYNQKVSMPPAYWDAIVYPLAISFCPSCGKSASPELRQLAAEALKAMQTNNMKSPKGTTLDAGMPGTGNGGFNWQTGGPA
jgi:hypothetical protein